MNNEIDFSPLSKYSKLYVMFRLIKRIKMVLVRVLILLIIAAIFGGLMYYIFVITPILNTPQYLSGEETIQSYGYSLDGGSISSNQIIPIILLIYFGPSLIAAQLMSIQWSSFSKRNGFKRLNRTPETHEQISDLMNIPSFGGKILQFSIGPVIGSLSQREFGFFTRQYKEGGVLRWRERQMDTVFVWVLPARLPHIVVNATANERARRSNMTSLRPNVDKFQFEGTWGSRYDVYADPSEQILALQLFTPDVLSVLYNELPSADIEVKDNKIWIVQRYGVLDDVLAKKMFNAAVRLKDEVEGQMKTAGMLNSPEDADKTEPVLLSLNH